MTLLARLRPPILDRYIIKEVVPPFGLGLLLFSFILLLQQITILMGTLISRDADLATILQVFVKLLPSIFSVTIPMAFLLAILLAFGRLASESEIVALRASGVSPLQLLRPVLVLSAAATLATFYVMALALPAANASYRQIMFSLVINKARTAVKPRVFTSDLLPGSRLLLYVKDIPSNTGLWQDVFVHDVQDVRRPAVILARSGRLVIDEAQRSVSLYLVDGVRYTFDRGDHTKDEQLDFQEHLVPLPEDAIFPQISISKGDREMTIVELVAKIRETGARGKLELNRRYRVELQKRFSIPLACLVFGLLGLGLSLGTRKEARSAAFALSVAIILVYYVLIRLGEQAGDTGMLSPVISMWAADVVLGLLAAVLLWLNYREAAFDPLDPAHYRPGAWLPRRPAAPKGTPLPRERRQPVVVVRVPRPRIRISGILDRYVARVYIGYLTLVMLGFWSLFLLVEFLDLFDDIQQHGIKGKLVLHYYLYHAPSIAYLVAPVGVLVATLTTFGVLSRRNEVTAMKAGGVSLYRVSLPALALGLLGSAALFLFAEFVLPYTNRVAARDYNVIKGRPPQATNYLDRRWILGSDERFYNYEYLDEHSRTRVGRAGPNGMALLGLSVYDVDAESWSLRDYLYTRRATWDGMAYELQDGWRRTYAPQPAVQRFALARSREIESPGYFKRETEESDTLRFGELKRQIDTLEAQGLDVTKLKVQLHRKLAFPLVTLVMTVIGVPFAFVVAQRGALYGVGVSVLIAILYWASLGIFEALGTYGLLPPLLAAWAPNLLFGSAGAFFMLNLRT